MDEAPSTQYANLAFVLLITKLPRGVVCTPGVDSRQQASALQVAKQSAANAELDSLLIHYRGDMQARGYQALAASEQYAGDVSRANARAARTAGWINAAGTVLGGYAQSLNLQPTTLPGAGLGYGTAGCAISGVNAGPW